MVLRQYGRGATAATTCLYGGNSEFLKHHRSVRYQRGSGIFSAISSLFGRLLPFASRAATRGASIATKIAKSTAGKKIGNIAADTATQIAADAIQGKDIKEAAGERLNTARGEVAQAIRESRQGTSGYKRKRKVKRAPLYEEDEDTNLSDGEGLDEQNSAKKSKRKRVRFKTKSKRA